MSSGVGVNISGLASSAAAFQTLIQAAAALEKKFNDLSKASAGAFKDLFSAAMVQDFQSFAAAVQSFDSKTLDKMRGLGKAFKGVADASGDLASNAGNLLQFARAVNILVEGINRFKPQVVNLNNLNSFAQSVQNVIDRINKITPVSPALTRSLNSVGSFIRVFIQLAKLSDEDAIDAQRRFETVFTSIKNIFNRVITTGQGFQAQTPAVNRTLNAVSQIFRAFFKLFQIDPGADFETKSNQFVDAISRILNRFKNVFISINFIDDKTDNKTFTRVINSFSLILTSVARLLSVGFDSDKLENAFAVFSRTIQQMLAVFNDAFKSINIVAFEKRAKAFRLLSKGAADINAVVTSLTSLGAAAPARVNDSQRTALKNLFSSYAEILRLVPEPQRLIASSKAVAALKTVVPDVNELIALIANLKVVGSDANSSLLKGIDSFLINLGSTFGGLAAIERIASGGKALKNITLFFKEFFTFFSSFDTTNIKINPKIFSEIISTVSKLFAALGGQNFDIKRIEAASAVFKNFRGVFAGLQEFFVGIEKVLQDRDAAGAAGGGRRRRSNNFTTVLKDFSKIVALITQIFITSFNSSSINEDRIAKVSLAFSRFKELFRNFGDFFVFFDQVFGKQFSLKRLGNISKFKRIAGILQRLVSSLDINFDADKLSKGALGIERAVRAVARLEKIQVPELRQRSLLFFSKRTDFAKNLDRLGDVLRKLVSSGGEAARQVKNIQDLSTIANFLFRSLNSIKIIRANTSDVTKTLSAFAETLYRIFKKLKGIKNVPDLRSFFEILKQVAESGSFNINLSKADPKNLEAQAKLVVSYLSIINKALRNTNLRNLKKLKDADLSPFARFFERAGGGSDLEKIKQTKQSFGEINRLAAQSAAAISAIDIAKGFLFAKVVVEITKSLKSLLRLQSNFTRFLNTLGRQISQLGFSLQNSLYFFRRLIDPYRLINNQGVQTAVAIDRISSQLPVFGGELFSDEAIDQLRRQLFQVASDFGTDLTQGFEAILDFAKTGLTPEEIGYIFPQVGALSALDPDLTLSRGAGILSTAITAFDRITADASGTVENAAYAADALAAAADISRASISGLTQSFNVGLAAFANAAGLTFEETLAGIVALNRVGVPEERAGTALRSALGALQRPIAREIFANLGIPFADELGRVRPLQDRLEDLIAVLSTRTEEERSILLSGIADVEGRSALEALLRAGGVAPIVQEMRGLASAADRARQSTDSLVGDFNRFRVEGRILIQEFVTPLFDSLFRPILRFGTRVLRFFNSLPEPLKDIVRSGAVVASAVIAVTVALTAAAAVTLRFGGGLLQAAGALAFFVAKTALVPIALGGFIASFGALVLTLGGIGSAVAVAAGVLTRFSAAVQQNLGGAGDSFERLKRSAADVFEGVKEVFVELAEAVARVFGFEFQGNLQENGRQIARFFDRVKAGADRFAEGLRNASRFIRVFNLFTSDIGVTSVNDYRAALQELAQTPLARFLFGEVNTASKIQDFYFKLIRFTNQLRQSFDFTTQGILGFFAGDPEAEANLRRGVGGFLSLLSQVVQKLTGINLGEAILRFESGELGAGLSSAVTSVVRQIRELILSNRDTIISLVSELLNPFNLLASVFRGLGFEDFANTLSNIGEVFEAFVRNFLGFVFDLISGENLLTAFKDNLGQFFIDLGNIFQSGFLRSLGEAFQTGDFREVLESALGGIRAFIQSVLDSVPGIFEALGEGLRSAFFDQIARILREGLSFENLQVLLDALIKDVETFLTSIKERFRELANSIDIPILSDIVRFIDKTGAFSTIVNSLSTVVSTAVSIIKKFADTLQNVFSLIESGNIEKLTLLGGALAAIFSPVIISSASALFGVLGRGLASLGRFVAVLSIISGVVSALQELTSVDGNLLSALGEGIFGLFDPVIRLVASVGSGVLDPLIQFLGNILGIQPTNVEGALVAFEQLRTIVQLLLRDLGTNIGYALRGVGEEIVLAFQRLFMTITNQGVELFDRTRAVFDQEGAALLESIVLLPEQGFDESVFNREVNINRQKIIDAAVAALQQAQLSDEDFATIARALYLTDLGEPVIELVDQQLAGRLRQALENLNLQAASETWVEYLRTTVEEVQSELPPLDLEMTIADSDRVFDELLEPTLTRLQERVSDQPITLPVLPVIENQGQTSRSPMSRPTNIPGRARGGELTPYSVYEVHDTPNPEVARFEDGRTLLFTGRSEGEMVQVVGRSTAPASPRTQPSTGLSRLSGRELSQQIYEESLEGVEDAAEDAARSVKDLTKELESLNKDIEKVWDDIQKLNEKESKEILKDLEKFQLDQRRQREDFDKDQRRAEEDLSRTLIDAIANRRAASAREAIERRNLERQRAEEDLRDRIKQQLEDKAISDRERAERFAERRAELQQERIELENRLLYVQAQLARQTSATQTAASQQTQAVEQSAQNQVQSTAAGENREATLTGISVAQQIAAMERLQTAATSMVSFFNNLAQNVQTRLQETPGGQRVVRTVQNLGDRFRRYLQGFAPAPTNTTAQRRPPARGFLPSAPRRFPAFAEGGLVTRTGGALVHRGELILPPAGRQPLSSPTYFGGININIDISAPSGVQLDENAMRRIAREEVLPRVSDALRRNR